MSNILKTNLLLQRLNKEALKNLQIINVKNYILI